jgi:hypothetical protein
MVAFAKADLPDSVNSVEKLAVWVSTLLEHLHPELTVIEATGASERAAASAPWKITAASPPTWRNISRMSIQLDSTWQRGGKIWNFAQDLSGATIPTEFKS